MVRGALRAVNRAGNAGADSVVYCSENHCEMRNMRKTQHFSRLFWVAGILCATWAHAGTGPISGPDNFEPDDDIFDPLQTRWIPIQDEGDSLRTQYRRNFDRPNDMDWMSFYADPGLFCFARANSLYPESDPMIGVYRVLDATEPFPDLVDPSEVCFLEQRYTTPDGRRLSLIACNDDIDFPVVDAEVTFDSDRGGQFYLLVRQSYKWTYDKGYPSGDQTTYSTEVTYFGVVGGAIAASVFDDADVEPITNAIVRIQPLNMTITENSNGIYGVGAVPAGTYTLKVQVPGYEDQLQTKVVNSGGLQNFEFPMLKIPDRHAIDFMDGDYQISLDELLRAIQFYNSNAFHCDPNGEDNFAPFPGSHNCKRHSADFLIFDWSIDLDELLRLIQFYNSAGYFVCEGSEDGFCPL